MAELPDPLAVYEDCLWEGRIASGQYTPDYQIAFLRAMGHYGAMYLHDHQLLRDLGKVAPPPGRCLGTCCEARSLRDCRPPVAEPVVEAEDHGPHPGDRRDDVPTWAIYDDDGEAD